MLKMINRKSLVYIAIVIATCLGLEIVARAIMWRAEPYTDTGTPRQGFSQQAMGDWTSDQDAVWIDNLAHPMYVHINESGFRNIDTLQRDRYRVLALGDSQTFGLFVSSHDIWTRGAQRHFNARTKHKIQILNNGLPGSTIVDHSAYLKEKAKRLSPDLVLLVIHSNDIDDLNQLDTSVGSTRDNMKKHARDAISRGYSFRRILNNNIAIYALARSLKDHFRRVNVVKEFREATPPNFNRVLRPRKKGGGTQTVPGNLSHERRIIEKYNRSFEQALAEVQKIRAKIAVVYLPGSGNSKTNKTRRTAITLAARYKFPFLDLVPALAKHNPADLFLIDPIISGPNQKSDYSSDGHLSRYGHAIVAREISKFLHGIIER